MWWPWKYVLVVFRVVNQYMLNGCEKTTHKTINNSNKLMFAKQCSNLNPLTFSPRVNGQEFYLSLDFPLNSTGKGAYFLPVAKNMSCLVGEEQLPCNPRQTKRSRDFVRYRWNEYIVFITHREISSKWRRRWTTDPECKNWALSRLIVSSVFVLRLM